MDVLILWSALLSAGPTLQAEAHGPVRPEFSGSRWGRSGLAAGCSF